MKLQKKLTIWALTICLLFPLYVIAQSIRFMVKLGTGTDPIKDET